MFELLLWLTAIVIVGGSLRAFMWTRDAFHPAIIMAPPLLYFYSFWPLVLNSNSLFNPFYNQSTLTYVASLFLVSITGMYLGLNHRLPHLRGRGRGLGNEFFSHLTPALQRRLYIMAIALGAIALIAYLSLFQGVSGIINAYSRAKGGFGSAGSGYVGEAMLLSFPAILVLALAARARGKTSLMDVLLALVIALPHLLQGTLGGRRGPLFIVLATLFFAWFIAKGRTPTLQQAMLSIAATGFIIISVFANRQDVYIGSDESFQFSKAFEAIVPDQLTTGNEYLSATAAVVASDFHQDFYWGYRYFVTFVIRPIPRQIWPTKYQDVGATWLGSAETEAGGAGYQALRYQEALGFRLLAGSSIGSIADGYMEFWWGVVLMFYLLGRAFNQVWKRHRREGGFWTILLFVMLSLSVYLPSQSFSAWMIRLLYMGVIGWLFWRWLIWQPRRVGSRLRPI